MLFSLSKKSIFTIYFSVIRPCLSVTYANMSSGSVEADKYSVAYVTAPNTDVAKKLAQGIVEGKLAACVNIIPQITSVYKWKDEIKMDSEVLLMIKTRTSQVDKLTEYVRSNHPYEVCEVISLPILNGNPPYLKWIGKVVPETDCPGCKDSNIEPDLGCAGCKD